jgi:hypothetical protein
VVGTPLSLYPQWSPNHVIARRPGATRTCPFCGLDAGIDIVISLRYRLVRLPAAHIRAAEGMIMTTTDAEPIEQSADPVRLLVHAVGQLPPAQRDLVLAWLLRQRPGLTRQWTLGARASEHAAELHDLQLSAFGQPVRGAVPTAQQVVPVRFPAQQHAQLRDWCGEHGFSMATVIRGLVARFLESQLPDRN